MTQLYVAGAFIGVGVGGLGPIAASTLIARRFGPRRGLALGILHGGDNLLNSFIPGITAALLATIGWRMTSGAFGLGYLGVAVVILAILHRGEGRSEGGSGRPAPSIRQVPWTSLTFYSICLSFFFAYAYIGAIIYHLIAYQTDLGLSRAFATGTMRFVVLAGFFGAVTAGAVAGRISPSRTLLAIHASLAVVSVGLWWSPGETTFRVWPWLHGFGMGAYAPLLPLVVAERFGAGSPALGATIGAVSVLGLTGAYAGNLAGGLTFDATGSYAIAWMGFTIALTASATFPAILAFRRVIGPEPEPGIQT